MKMKEKNEREYELRTYDFLRKIIKKSNQLPRKKRKEKGWYL